MRTINEIVIAVQENEKEISEEELRLCVVALQSIVHFYRHDLIKLIEAIRDGKKEGILKLNADFAWKTIESMFNAGKTAPDKWLGEGNIPGTEENIKRRNLGKKIFKDATGIDL